MTSVHASPTSLAAAGKPKHEHQPNPAQAAKAAEPAVRGSDFGALVASFARAKHAPAVATPATTGLAVPVSSTNLASTAGGLANVTV